MKVVRIVAGVTAALVLVPWIAKALGTLVRDLARYGRIRSMSDQGSLADELPQMISDLGASESKAVRDVLTSVESLPSDAARYVRMKMM